MYHKKMNEFLNINFTHHIIYVTCVSKIIEETYVVILLCAMKGEFSL